MWQVHNNCFLHFILLLTKKCPTVHVILLFRSGQTVRAGSMSYDYGRASRLWSSYFYTLNPLLTHTLYRPVRTRTVHINESQHDKTNKLICAPSEDSDQPGHPPSLISLFPPAFVAGSFKGHWWGFISRNYVVWPIFFLMNVFIALKGTHFLFLFARCALNG